MSEEKKVKIGVKTNLSTAKAKTAGQRARKKSFATLLCILGTEDDLSGLQLDSVSLPVREWLTGTFTMRTAIRKTKPEIYTKPRIITQSVEDLSQTRRKYRTSTSSTGIAYPSDVVAAFKDVDKWDFDVFVLHETSRGHSLKYVICEMFNKYDLLTRYEIPLTTLIDFAEALEEGYGKYHNTYHNATHAADVTQTVHIILMHTGTLHWFNDLEILAIFFSASVHDLEHTGTTNEFHIQTRSPMALLYNDTSVQENHHLSAAYQLVQKPDLNILGALSESEWRDMRRLVIKMVLGTDMSSHFHDMKTTLCGLKQRESLDRSIVMSTIIHVADLSHPAKPWKLHLRWSEGILDEFFKQGAMEAELGLPISPLCDRETTNIPESQIGFIDIIVEPVFDLLFEVIEKLIVPFLQKNPPSRKPCRKSTEGSDAQSVQTRHSIADDKGPCPTTLLSSIDIPKFVNEIYENIQANREKWAEFLRPRNKESPGTESNEPKDHASEDKARTKKSLKRKKNSPVAKENTEAKENTVAKENTEAKDNTVAEDNSAAKDNSVVKDNVKAKDNTEAKSKTVAKAKTAAKGKCAAKGDTEAPKSKDYCTVQQEPKTCDCQLCDNKAFNSMDVNFIVYNAASPAMFLARQDSEAMEVTESYEELTDRESSWRKTAGQTLEANIQEMRALVPKTKPLAPNESDDVIVEEFIPEDRQQQPGLPSGPPAVSGQECPQPSSNIGFIMTDLSQSDMEIFSLWNEEVMRRAAEQQKQGHGGMPDDAPLQVAVAAQQHMDCQGSPGASEGTPSDTFVLQVISFDSPSVTYSKDAVLTCDPGQQVAAPTNNAVVPANTPQESQAAAAAAAAAVSVTSLSYGVFKVPQ